MIILFYSLCSLATNNFLVKYEEETSNLSHQSHNKMQVTFKFVRFPQESFTKIIRHNNVSSQARKSKRKMSEYQMTKKVKKKTQLYAKRLILL